MNQNATRRTPKAPQFTATVTGGSKTGELYEWLGKEGLLWMLEPPYDRRLEIFAGSAPVTRMWHWKLRQRVKSAVPENPSAIDTAFAKVERKISALEAG